MKKAKVLALVMIFAIAALGGAYAAWSDSIFVNETVNTGVVNIQWQNLYESDGTPPPNWDWDGGIDQQVSGFTNYGNLNVGSKEAEIKDEKDTNGAVALKGEGDVLEVTLKNGYPGYKANVSADIANIGTIPVRFTFKEDENNRVPEWMIVKIVDFWNGSVYWASDDTSTSPIPTLNKNEKRKVKIVEEIIDNNTPENASTTFKIELVGTQWNYNQPTP